MKTPTLIVTLITLLNLMPLQPACASASHNWEPVNLKLKTPWTEKVSPSNALTQYPRPQLQRKQWQNHNGLWEYAITPSTSSAPEKYQGNILVPFCLESALSGVSKTITPTQALWYKRTINLKKPSNNNRVILHFGAVDWKTEVFVNGQSVGKHTGGYTPFSFDITDTMNNTRQQTISLRVIDPTNAGYQPRGKQVNDPKGIWYTAVTGIWQTVWTEQVPATHIQSIKITPDIDKQTVTITANTSVKTNGSVSITVLDKNKTITRKTGSANTRIVIPVSNPKLWSPDSPFLYTLNIKLATVASIDTITSYFGMRKIERKTAADGFQRLFLNNKPLFQFGPLDQGWWPDGLYTAPTDEALKFDIEMTRKLGFNMARKHVKVEPARWYYWADKLGLLVWQDMPNGDGHIPPNAPKDFERSKESQDNYNREWKDLIDHFYNSPCIVVWVPFNEGWGQSQSTRVIKWTQKYDPTRIVGGPSGWADRGVGDLYDMHKYPGPGMFPTQDDRVSVLGEYGGLGLPLEDHLWWNKRNWGYRTYKTKKELWENYQRLGHQLPGLIGKGLAAAIYTQTTDVEGEVNGLMTYDRQVIKFDVDAIRKLNNIVYLPPPITKIILPTANKTHKPAMWQYTTAKPAENWFKHHFNDSQWKKGLQGFGNGDPRQAKHNTKWTSSDIWIRRSFDLGVPVNGSLWLNLFYDDHTEVYINGIKVVALKGYSTDYINFPLPDAVVKSLKAKNNSIAIHTFQVAGGQYIDAGLSALIYPTKK